MVELFLVFPNHRQHLKSYTCENNFRSISKPRKCSGVASEDGWYDSDKWDEISKSKPRIINPQTKGQETWDSGTSESSSPMDVEWLRLVGCDICLPKERRQSIDNPRRFQAIIHFVGGVFAGTFPGQAYGPFIEELTRRGRFITIATPCAALSGMDHLKASYEAALKFESACRALEAELGSEMLRAGDLPHIGVGHSLGCKVHVVMGSLRDCRRAAGPRRIANVMLAYNNFGARESVPILSELSEAVRSLQQGAVAAAPALAALTENLRAAAVNVPMLRDVLGTGRGAQFINVLEQLGIAAQGLAAGASDRVLEEFSPSPADTDRMLRADYVVGRNLVVEFDNDNIDQSPSLCTALRERFASRGRLVLRRLPGTHLTPNTPRIDPATLQEGPVRELALRTQRELQRLCDVVAAFVSEEAEAAALMPPEPDLDGGGRLRPGE